MVVAVIEVHGGRLQIELEDALIRNGRLLRIPREVGDDVLRLVDRCPCNRLPAASRLSTRPCAGGSNN